jgi:hypothetical protein
MPIESKILTKEKVRNKNRLFGSTTDYFPVFIKLDDGKETPALFTENELKVAMERAAKNPEDISTAGGGFFKWLVD